MGRLVGYPGHEDDCPGDQSSCACVRPGPDPMREQARQYAAAVKREGLAAHYRMFARNGRWGTCVGCPRDSEHMAYPEFCQFTTRYDHWLNAARLAERFAFELRDQERADAEDARLREARTRARKTGAHVPDGDS